MLAGDRSGRVQAESGEGRSRWETRFEGQDATVARLSLPYMAVQDAKSQVYIADKVAHAVRMVDGIGQIHTLAGTGLESNGSDKAQVATRCGLAYPNALWVHPAGRLYVLDFGNAKLRRVDPDGQISTVFELPKSLQGGRGLAVSQDESEFFVAAKDRIYRYSKKDGVSVLATGFVNLGHLAIAGPAALWAADRDAGVVYRVLADGTKTPVAGNGTIKRVATPAKAIEQGLDMPRALAVLPGKGLLIGTQGGRRVYLLDPNGLLHLLLDGKNPNQRASGPLALEIHEALDKLRGLSIAPNGDLLLSHGDTGQVLRFARNGA